MEYQLEYGNTFPFWGASLGLFSGIFHLLLISANHLTSQSFGIMEQEPDSFTQHGGHVQRPEFSLGVALGRELASCSWIFWIMICGWPICWNRHEKEREFTFSATYSHLTPAACSHRYLHWSGKTEDWNAHMNPVWEHTCWDLRFWRSMPFNARNWTCDVIVPRLVCTICIF